MLNSVRHRVRFFFAIIIVIVIAVYLFVQFATSDERRLYALDAATGKIAWSAVLDWNWSSYAAPVLDNGKVFVATNDVFTQPRTEHWQLSAYESSSGRLLWNYAPFAQAGAGQLCASTIAAPPVVANGQVYVYLCAATNPDDTTTFDKTSIVALDESTGAILWEHDEPSLENVLKQGAPLTLRVLNGSVYVLSMESLGQWGIDVLDEKRGKLVRRINLPELVNEDPPSLSVDGLETDGQSLFFNVKGLASLDPISSKANYTLQVRNAPWIAQNGLYASLSDGQKQQIVAYDVKTGAVRWQRVLDKSLIPDAPDDNLTFSIQIRTDEQAMYVFVIHHPEGQVWLVALNPSDGSTRWVKQIQMEPSLANILARVATTSDLVAYEEAGDVNGVRVVSASDGSARWFFPGYTELAAPAIDGQHVYLFDASARYRNWLALLSPAWHGG